jgi:hypothetical protein
MLMSTLIERFLRLNWPLDNRSTTMHNINTGAGTKIVVSFTSTQIEFVFVYSFGALKLAESFVHATKVQ